MYNINKDGHVKAREKYLQKGGVTKIRLAESGNIKIQNNEKQLNQYKDPHSSGLNRGQEMFTVTKINAKVKILYILYMANI